MTDVAMVEPRCATRCDGDEMRHSGIVPSGHVAIVGMRTAARAGTGSADPKSGVIAVDALKGLLLKGPRASRGVLAALQADGLTAKQVRTARERLGVVIERTGSGTAMRSTWRLPDAQTRAAGATKVAADSRPRRGRHGAGKRPAAEVAANKLLAPRSEAPVANPPLTELEAARIRQRVDLFVRRGLEKEAAHALAEKLVHERDRPGDPKGGGSCIECQSYVRHECVVGPKSLDAIHYCIFMRNDAR